MGGGKLRVLMCLWDLQLHLYQLIIASVAKTTGRVLIRKIENFDEATKGSENKAVLSSERLPAVAQSVWSRFALILAALLFPCILIHFVNKALFQPQLGEAFYAAQSSL